MPAEWSEAALPPAPGLDNRFHVAHARLLVESYRHWTARDLIAAEPAHDLGQRLFEAPFAVLSHGTGADPTFTYGNRTALALFETAWDDLLRLPSRLSAEQLAQAERARLLAAVTAQGYVDDYAGVRISRRGRRFRVRQATVWMLVDAMGAPVGQAAALTEWEPLD